MKLHKFIHESDEDSICIAEIKPWIRGKLYEKANSNRVDYIITEEKEVEYTHKQYGPPCWDKMCDCHIKYTIRTGIVKTILFYRRK